MLARPLEEVFPFFSDAYNLEQITPDFLKFRVLTPRPIEMRPGTLIDYKLRVRGLPLRWQSEITVWDPPLRFVDEQRRGPYRLWHHEHLFEARAGETLVRDIVDYAVWGGALIDRLFVRRDVERIFRFRQQVLASMFS
ncbi:MAG: SRPBCC family protein [Acidobacteriota bacterium]|nr:MAG: SRPBCC family protein [Acidobacteriota bacterium]